MRSSWCRTAALLGVVALIGAACADEAEETGGEGERPTVVFQGFPADPAALPLLVMQEEGFDEENGFVGEYLAVDPDAATNTFLIGESDIAMEQDGINMTIVQQEGHEAVLFAPGLNMMTGIVVPEDSPYQDPTDLVGEKVGHFGVDSGTTSTIALMLREIYDLDVLSEYDLRETGPEALPELLKSGEVEAIFDFEPLALRAVLETPGRYLFEPAKSFLELKSDEELEAFIDYCVNLPCFGTTWTEEDIQGLNDYLELFAQHDILIEETAEEPVAVILEDYFEE